MQNIEIQSLPNSVQAEQAIISAILADGGVLADIGGTVTTEMFYGSENRLIFGALSDMAAKGRPADAVMLCDALGASEQLERAGGLEYIADLATQGGSRNGKHYAEIVRNKYLERQLIQAARAIMDLSGDSKIPVEQRLADAQAQLLAVMDSAPQGEATHINDAMKKAVASIEERGERGTDLIGVSSGFKDLDALVGGFKPGEMILVAGRPSMGKSTLAQNFIEHAALAGLNVLFFSVEMPEEMVAIRHLSSLGKASLENLIQARVKDLGEEIVAAGAKMRNRFYHIDDSPSLISSQILLRAQRLQMKTGKPLDLIVVDYIQKLRDPGDNQNQRVQEISGNIKHAARVLNCPIVALSQLSRDCEKRQDKRPMLSDLRDSGSLEQDADIVMFVYRDEVYDKNSNLSGIAEVLVRKNRNGRTGDCSLTSRLEFARFENFTGMRPEQIKRSYGLE